MKIGISTRGLNQGSYAISTIILHLTRALLDLGRDRHQFTLYFNDPALEALFPTAENRRSIHIKNRFAWDHLWLPQALKKDGVEIALLMKGTLPFYLPCQGAVLYHDLGYFDNVLHPYKFMDTIYMKVMMARASHQAAHIFADSVYTRDEALHVLGMEPSKISVCYQNCSPIFKLVTDPLMLKSVRERYRLPEQFIFSPVTLSPRKNIARILNAFQKVQEHIPHHLVITGGQSWGLNQPQAGVSGESAPRIHFVGTISQNDMPAIYSLAGFTLYPSLIEGFGMPILEAFNCGCPVLTSNITSMPELAGEAAYLVDPYDEQQISEGILKLALDDRYSQELAGKGFARAKLFSWEKTAGAILEKLETLERVDPGRSLEVRM
jgi:glycosyltransferase involved in cell wall biosynthesis